MKLEKAIQTIWEYEVRSDHASEFQNYYGPNGDWVKLFNQCPGYVKTELRRDFNKPNRFITLDYWQSYSDYLSMKQMIASEYQTLDKLCEAFTSSENHIGIFEILDNN